MAPRKAERVPSPEERRQPGLSQTLRGPVARNVCQSCGHLEGEPLEIGDPSLFGKPLHPDDCRGLVMQRWRECDEWDQPTSVIVVLCERCAKRLIDPHPRLYMPLWPSDPIPGMLPICDDCPHRQATRCVLAKASGGGGVFFHFDKEPTRAHLCGSGPGGRWGRTVAMYGKVTRCDQKEGAPAGQRLAPASNPGDIAGPPDRSE
jgi:hypothetical protein